MTDITSKFLNSYSASLSTFMAEIQQNEQAIRLAAENIEKITPQIQKNFKRIVEEAMLKPRLTRYDRDIRDIEIKQIYFKICEIQKLETEKRALTKESCNIIDKYFSSLGRIVEKVQSKPVNADGRSDMFASIKNHLNKPVEGDAVVVDLIKKKEKRQQEANAFFNGDKRYSSVFTSMLKDFLKQNTMASDKTPQMECSLPTFIDKVLGICREIRNRYGIGETSNAQPTPSTSSDAKKAATMMAAYARDYGYLCHCRLVEFGPMVECDSKNCEIKWFHFECVALTKSPEGMWFCPSCAIFGNENDKNPVEHPSLP